MIHSNCLRPKKALPLTPPPLSGQVYYDALGAPVLEFHAAVLPLPWARKTTRPVTTDERVLAASSLPTVSSRFSGLKPKWYILGKTRDGWITVEGERQRNLSLVLSL